MDNIFEYATQNKLRFGDRYLSVEDLWDLPLTSVKSNWDCLDTVAKQIYKQIKEVEEISFVEETTKSNKNLQISLEIVKHIIAVKKEEIKQQMLQKTKLEEKELILKALKNKKIEEINSLSQEQLLQKLNDK